jgi:16S rRNA G966 N2-methylase RsmD
MVKEAMFNLLRGHFEGEAVLDCFSGTGTIGLEAASRGASRVVCVERDHRVTKVLEKNIEMLGAEETVEIVTGDALGPATISRCPKPVHVIFFDPPYPMVRDEEDWVRVKRQFTRLIELLDDTGYAVLRTPWPMVHKFPVETEDDSSENSNTISRDDLNIEEIEGEEVIEIDLNDPNADAIMESFEKDMRRDASKPKFRTVDVDLAMDGALGPETHSYGQMALHLYMRDPDAKA